MCSPIGFFDSGVGGLSIWKEVVGLLPSENTYYLSDSINAPYGQKMIDSLQSFCKKNTEFLLKKDCKMIVVACNTATTNAIAFLRKNYPRVIFVGIEPAIKPAALKTKKKRIGVLATQSTLYSNLFSKSSKKFLKNIQVVEQKGTGLAELIEQGKADGIQMKALLKKYITPMLAADIDYLVLGCSHYTFLIPQIQNIAQNTFKIIDSSKAVAKRIEFVLRENNLINICQEKATHKIRTNGDSEIVNHYLQKLGFKMQAEKACF